MLADELITGSCNGADPHCALLLLSGVLDTVWAVMGQHLPAASPRSSQRPFNAVLKQHMNLSASAVSAPVLHFITCPACAMLCACDLIDRDRERDRDSGIKLYAYSHQGRMEQSRCAEADDAMQCEIVEVPMCL